MTDQEIADFCGFKPTDNQAAVKRYIDALTPAQRNLFEKMRQVEMWDATGGLVPLPAGVIVDRPNRRNRYHKSNSE